MFRLLTIPFRQATDSRTMPTMVTSTCTHESVLWDVDEYRCRTCSRSLTFPTRPPGPEDAKNRRRDSRRKVEDMQVEVEETEETEEETTQLLICHCCKEMLPLDSFHVRNHPAAEIRHFRASRCVGCTAFRLRVRRQQDPDGMRSRDRERRNPGQPRPATTAETIAANTAAGQRYRARQAGRPVLKQRRGKLSIHVKPICRVFETCPLRSYCTVEKGLT